ncbi:O-antigen ligase family protein [uncultured Algibacter sp.]|uniref:O-antigen ligase family protein n=1 Tax=uncultured Algibacter sp. TaxID=298659 RepID=UPI00262B2293|nr:O-antigen ligase family protein [uncultured Algibacter sp.]
MHILIGFSIFNFRALSKVYLIAIFIYFIIQILKAKPSEKALKVLMACSYVVGAEVFLRMTGGSLLYETSKYLVILFTLVGLFTVKSSKVAIPFVVYVLLLIPGIFVAGFSATEETELRKAIAFNLSGPVCLGIVSIFCYKLKINYENIHKVLLNMALPMISITTYLFLYTPDLQEVITGTGSNFAASGGFGPNQVSTVLGLGMFVFSIRFFMLSPTLFFKLVNGFLLAVMSFRGIVTFSRGGVITALFMIAVFIYFYFKRVNKKGKFRISRLVIVFAGLGLLIWLFSSIQTSGLIENRYANKDAIGREKADVSTGRSDLIFFELEEFFKNPIVGVGVGKIKELRLKREGVTVASHNEMSRILSEHGLFGLTAILILLLTPLFLRIGNKSNFFFYSCYIFWFLTINHSSMRIAAPAFVYGLCLLDIQYKTNRVKKVQQFKNKKQSTLISH